MATKKNTVEEVKETEQVVVDEEPTVEVTEEVIDDDAVEVEAEEKAEKKPGFIKKWFNNQKEEFKAHPVKKTLKTAGELAIGGLAIIGGRTVVKTIVDNADAIDTDAVELLTDTAIDTAEETIAE